MNYLVILSLCVLPTYAVIQLQKLSSLKIPANAGGDFAMFSGAAHRAAYDKRNRYLYVVSEQHNSNKSLNFLHVVDLVDPTSPKLILTHPFDDHASSGPTDVAVCNHPTDLSFDVVAVTVPSAYAAFPGKVEIFEPFNRFQTDLLKLGSVSVGHSPKSMAFTSDCTQLVVANEGLPGLDGPASSPSSAFVDPEGSISIILSSKNSNPATMLIDFRSFNDRAQEYVNREVRWVFRGDRDNYVVNTFSQDLEPESVAISSDDRYVFVTMTENNAIAKIDLSLRTVIDIYPMGSKDYTKFDVDTSDMDGGDQLGRYNVHGLYQPSTVRYGVIDGKGYLITADQGAYKTVHYKTSSGITETFTDAIRVKTAVADGLLDRVSMDSQTEMDINDDSKLGRIHMSIMDGYNCLFGKIEKVHIFGGRGVSMIDASTMTRSYDTGDDLERRQATQFSRVFNGDCSSLSQSPAGESDSRSDDMGPEPEGLAIGTVGGTSVFVVGSRNGVLSVFSMRGVAAYFESKYRDGSTSGLWSALYDQDNVGDTIITDIGFVEAMDSTTGQPFIYVIGSASGTVGVYQLANAST